MNYTWLTWLKNSWVTPRLVKPNRRHLINLFPCALLEMEIPLIRLLFIGSRKLSKSVTPKRERGIILYRSFVYSNVITLTLGRSNRDYLGWRIYFKWIHLCHIPDPSDFSWYCYFFIFFFFKLDLSPFDIKGRFFSG
jgi:hypothetical protein